MCQFKSVSLLSENGMNIGYTSGPLVWMHRDETIPEKPIDLPPSQSSALRSDSRTCLLPTDPPASQCENV